MADTANVDIDKLQSFYDARDRRSYYAYVFSKGDPYGDLAGGVVTQSQISGQTAKKFAEKVCDLHGINLDAALWRKVSEGLMAADFAARRPKILQQGRMTRLSWREIRAYHNSVFELNGLPVIAWTAEIPLSIVDETDAPGLAPTSRVGADARASALWDDFLRDGWVVAGCEALAPIMQAIAHKAGWDLTAAQQARLATLPGAPAVLSYHPSATETVMMSLTPAGSVIQESISMMKSISTMSFSWNNSARLYCEKAVDVMSCARHLSEEERHALFWFNCIMGVGVINMPSEIGSVLRTLFTTQGQSDAARTIRDMMFNHQIFRNNPIQWLSSGAH